MGGTCNTRWGNVLRFTDNALSQLVSPTDRHWSESPLSNSIALNCCHERKLTFICHFAPFSLNKAWKHMSGPPFVCRCNEYESALFNTSVMEGAQVDLMALGVQLSFVHPLISFYVGFTWYNKILFKWKMYSFIETNVLQNRETVLNLYLSMIGSFWLLHGSACSHVEGWVYLFPLYDCATTIKVVWEQ